MRRFTIVAAIAALIAVAAFGMRGGVFAQDASPVPDVTPVTEPTEAVAGVPAATPTAEPGGAVTLVLVERATSDETIDLGDEGDSAGDLLVFANDVYDEANATQVGTDNGSCIRTVAGSAYECAWTVTLDDGQIMVQGPFLDSGESVLAVTGGTGAYAGISGQLRLAAGDEGTYVFTFELQ